MSRPQDSILRACGDVSHNRHTEDQTELYSPRMRRCFFPSTLKKGFVQVFSAHAEMFLSSISRWIFPESILRACGDVSVPDIVDRASFRYSPRMRRCFSYRSSCCFLGFVFSAHAEMFLMAFFVSAVIIRILRACGDVSAYMTSYDFRFWYSLRMRRCFRFLFIILSLMNVFSAHAEMFLHGFRILYFSVSILRACGDVSYGNLHDVVTGKYSPRM